MVPDPPPSLLVTPDRRRRLTQLFTEARQLAAQPRMSVRRVHDVLGECVRGDPGNFLYFDALLANLAERPAANLIQRLWRRLHAPFGGHSPSAGRDASAGGFTAAYRLLQRGPELLWQASDSVPLLRQLAEAAGECAFEEVELRLLNEARRLAADDVDTLRQVARTLTRHGRFEEAVGPWHAVAALVPDDGEALAAIDDLSSARQGFDGAERQLADAQATRGGDLALLAERQRLRLEQSEQRVAMARVRAEHDSHPRAKTLVERLESDHRRLQIEVLAMQAEQRPLDVMVRIELARALLSSGNSSAAAAMFEEALRLSPNEAATLVELGECRQRLRQFEAALACYLQAESASAGEAGVETKLLAAYRAGVLAAAMGKLEMARSRLEFVLGERPDYRDVREHLAALSDYASGGA
jgi:tetratricopeptide (TPR) repeat protein